MFIYYTYLGFKYTLNLHVKSELSKITKKSLLTCTHTHSETTSIQNKIKGKRHLS